MNRFRSEVFSDPEPGISRKGSNGWRQSLRDILETLILSILLFLAINVVSARIRVESVSMQPTLYEGNYVIVSKVAYKLGNPSRGDVIVFRYPPHPEQEPYIKRVVGLPGDQVHIEDGEVYLNGNLFVEPYLHVSTTSGGDWTVPPDSLFVMGDNRNNSSDSRAWGMVPYANVIGKAELVYWPPEKWGLLGFPYAAAAEP